MCHIWLSRFYIHRGSKRSQPSEYAINYFSSAGNWRLHNVCAKIENYESVIAIVNHWKQRKTKKKKMIYNKQALEWKICEMSSPRDQFT